MTTFHERIYNQMMENQRLGSKMLFVLPHRKAGQTWMKSFIHLNPNMKPIFNKWQWWFSPFQRDYMRYERGWKIFSCGIVKIHTAPPAGEEVRKMHYDGFVIRFAWWLPFDRV